MKINEIFYSLQGEGKWSGLLNIFIRTSGCNLRCTYCDTKYAYENGNNKSIEQIQKKIKEYPNKKICITGGEPLIQDEIYDLLNFLLNDDYKIEIETNGSINIDKIPKNKSILISLDIKCPSSNMHEKMILNNIALLEEKDQIKFIIKNEKDYEYAKKIIDHYNPKCDIYFQPVWDEKIDLAEWILKDNLNVKLGLQIHKILNLK